MSTPAPPASPADLNKAYGAGGATLIGGAVAKIVIHIINSSWPGWLDTDTANSVDTLVVAAIAFIGAYYIPHSKG